MPSRRRRPPPDTAASGEPSPPVADHRGTEAAFQPLWPSHCHIPAGSDVGRSAHLIGGQRLKRRLYREKHGQKGRRPGQPPVAAMSLFSQIFDPQGRGWASASLKLARQATQPQARIVVPCCVPLPSARPGPCHQALASAAGKAGIRSEIGSNRPSSKRWGGRPQLPAVPGVPTDQVPPCHSLVRRSLSTSAGGQPPRSRTRPGRQVHHPGRARAGPAAGELSGALCHMNRFELGQPIATNVHQLPVVGGPMRLRYG